jgi:hypothetical protein
LYVTIAVTIIVTGILMLLIAARIKDQNSIKAIYLVQGQGELDQQELAKHPEIVVTGSFEKLKAYSKQKVAIWIDKNANTVDVHDWLRSAPQFFYPMVLVGYGDDNYAFNDQLVLSCYYSDPITCGDNVERRPDPGFSVLQLTTVNQPNGSLGMLPGSAVVFKQGYRYKPHVEDILTITNGLLNGTFPRPPSPYDRL